MTASITHAGVTVTSPAGAAQSGSPAIFTGQDFTTDKTYTITAADGSTQTYTVTVNTSSPGITVNVEGLSALAFSGLPPGVTPGLMVTLTISGGVTPDAWYVDINGPVSSTPGSNAEGEAFVTFGTPTTEGFYNVNVIATVDGVDYSGSFGLTVSE
jgi:hypothetical protein